MTQVQDPALCLVETFTIDLSSSIQPVQIPLWSLPALQQINTPSQLGAICKLTEGALIPLSRIPNRPVPNTETWGTPVVMSHQLDVPPFSTTL